MFLRADRVTLEFPLHSRHRHALGPAGGAPLGGQLMARGRRQYVRAIDDVSFDLREGDRLALVGHNGSGKSSLLRALAGIYQPNTGRIEASAPVSGIFNMNLGFRQEASGYRNIVLKGLMSGRSRAEIDAALPGIAEFTGLGPYLDMPLHSYSQGMAMRLAFAATTAFTNDILVMDEWIGAGDAGFQEKIIARMNDFLHAATIIVVASHSATLLRRIASRAIWLEHGRVRAMGGTEVIDAYESSVLVESLEPAVREHVRDRRGLWQLPAGTIDDGPAQLLWNVIGGAEDLQLVLRQQDGSVQAVRNVVRRCGAWPLAPWVRPGMRFEIRSARMDECIADCTIDERTAATA
ncbi:MAG: ATP-binding cassette domain-containing protein [Thermomonas sp.]